MRAVETIITSGSPKLVWNVLADVEHWNKWTPTVVEIKALDGNGLRVGSHFRVVQPKLRPAIYEVTEFVPSQRFTWAQKVLGGAMIADHRIAPFSGGSEVELSFTAKGFAANMVANLFSRTIRQYVAAEAKSLKRHCDHLASEESSNAGTHRSNSDRPHALGSKQ
jgi:hypothetical protein